MVLISSSTSASYQKAGQTKSCTFLCYGPKSSKAQNGKGLFKYVAALGCSTEREHKNREIFILSFIAVSYTPLHRLWISEHLFKDPCVQKLFTLTEATIHCWVPEERAWSYIELLSMYPGNQNSGNCCCSHHAFWSDENATAKGFLWNLNNSEEDREISGRSSFFMLFFTEAKLYRRDDLSGSYILPVKTASSILQTCTLLLSTFRETLQFHSAIATVAIQASTEAKCDVIFFITFLHFFSHLSLWHQLQFIYPLALMLTVLDVIGKDETLF